MAEPSTQPRPETESPESNGSITDTFADDERPLAGYTALTATFVSAFAGSLIAARMAGRKLPESYSPWDALMVGLATHKIARLITKDRVTSFIRAPFVRYERDTGHGEVAEEPQGEGIRLATGQLLKCPHCLGNWVAGGFGVGMVAAPNLTRLVAFMYTAETVADFAQLAYVTAKDESDAGEA